MNTMSSKRPYQLKERAKRQEATRRRIAEVTAELHEEVGPARTTITEVAKRAGVQRLTVYKHYPTDADLFEGCSVHYMSEHPFPDVTGALSNEDPERRVRETLTLTYGWFRETEAMTANIQRDRLLIPELDARASKMMDPALEWIAAELNGGFGAKGAHAERIAAMVAVAMDFWTWRRLKRLGMDDAAAAKLMADAVARA